MMRTRKPASCEGAGCNVDSSSEIALPSDSNASVDGRAVTAEYDSAKACGEAGIAEGCAQRVALFPVSSVLSVVFPKPDFKR